MTMHSPIRSQPVPVRLMRALAAGCRWALVLALASALLLPPPLPAGLGPDPALALAWPGRPSSAPVPAVPHSLGLQEQPPPPAVQQLQSALDRRQPQVEILKPADGSLMAAGDWELRMQVSDWPLVDAGPLGLGPHLLVQIDDQPPLATTATSLRLPPLSPGSHRVAVVAARPWGEAVKQPRAFAQVRLHRVAADPQGLASPGSPQLITVAPTAAATRQPVLVDWLMPDAPLQNLRPDDTGWRLRLTVNGDSVLLDRQHPLWLSGWKPGSNAVVLELLNSRGEALNPPYTSQVLEVMVDGSAPVPRWRQGSLEPLELAQLLGEAPPDPAPAPAPAVEHESAASAPPESAPEPVIAAPSPLEEPMTATAPLSAPEAPEPEGDDTTELVTEPSEPPDDSEIPAPERVEASPSTVDTPAPVDSAEGDADRIRPTATLEGSARSQVNDDGTLRRTEASGPLAGLRQRLGR